MMGTLPAALRDRTYLIWSGALLLVLGCSLVAAAQGGNAATTSVVATPTAEATADATATPQPPSLSQVFIDTRRKADLELIATTLGAYHDEHGAFPSTESNTMTVCTSGFEPGCLLLSIAPKLPATDGYEPYWYRSDGASYVVFAQIERADPAHPCPNDAPGALRPGDVYCIQYRETDTP